MAGYLKVPIVVVYQKSKRKNGRKYLKVFRDESLDGILTKRYSTLGLHPDSYIVKIGIGETFIKRYKEKYSIK